MALILERGSTYIKDPLGESNGLMFDNCLVVRYELTDKNRK